MKKIKIKTLYLIGIITIGLIGLGIGSTYAMFTTSIEIDNPISISTTLTSESDVIETFDIEVESNDIEVIELTIINGSTTSLNYSSFYITDNKDIEVGVTHNFSDSSVPTGNINNNENKKVYIQIKNNNSSKEKVTIGVLSNSGNIIKSDEMILVQDNNIDTTSPKILITGQDMIVKDGLIRYYNAINNLEYSHSSNTTMWKDLSGNYDGEVNDVTWNDTYATLNGTSSNVRMGQINNLSNITIEVFFKVNSFTSNGTDYIISNNNDLGIQLYNGKPQFSIGSGKVVGIEEVIDVGVIHTLIGTYDGSTLKIYMDGVLRNSIEQTEGISSSVNNIPLVIGCNPSQEGCTGNYTTSSIYAVRIYNRALSNDEIRQNMNADRISAGDKIIDNNGTYTFIANKKLNNFTSDNITITNGTKGVFTKINDRKYNLDISDVASSSTLTVNVPENVFTDKSGNKNTSLTLSRYRDNTGPVVTITRNTSSSRTVTYTFTFDEDTYGFTRDDITISEGTKGTFTKVNQKKYTLVVTHSSDGSKTITVNAGICYDLNGNPNIAKSLTHTITTVDTTKPTATITTTGKTNNSATFTITWSKYCTGFSEAKVYSYNISDRGNVSSRDCGKDNWLEIRSGKVYEFMPHELCVKTGIGVEITIPALACRDAAGKYNDKITRRFYWRDYE